MKVVVRTRWRAGRLADKPLSLRARCGRLPARHCNGLRCGRPAVSHKRWFGGIDAGGPPLARQPGAGITMAFTRLLIPWSCLDILTLRTSTCQLFSHATIRRRNSCDHVMCQPFVEHRHSLIRFELLPPKPGYHYQTCQWNC